MSFAGPWRKGIGSGAGTRPGWLSLACAAIWSCRVDTAFHEPDPGWNRMLEVPRYDSYEESQFFPDRMTMRRPPEGTIPFDALVGDEPLISGVEAGAFVEDYPIELTPKVIARGRDRFQRICAACHGVDGHVNPMVAQHMQRPPPSLHEERLRALPPGKLYYVIARGYGYMPSLENKLEVPDRWAVAAYVQVLQRSQFAPLVSLPPQLRGQVEARLP